MTKAEIIDAIKKSSREDHPEIFVAICEVAYDEDTEGECAILVRKEHPDAGSSILNALDAELP